MAGFPLLPFLVNAMVAPEQSSSRLPIEVQRLMDLARSLSVSSSYLEDKYWRGLLGREVQKILHNKKGLCLERALMRLQDNGEPDAAENLLEQVQTQTESTRIEHEGQAYDVLLFSAPILAWTRYQLPQEQALSAKQAKALAQLLQTHIAAPDTHLALIPQLLQSEQLPEDFQQTYQLTLKLARAALRGTRVTLAPVEEPWDGLLVDARFLVGAIVAPADAPLFRWQSPAAQPGKLACFDAWRDAALPMLQPLFMGCSIQCPQADAWYISNRETDRRMRPLALQAVVTWLQNSFSDLCATVVGCGQDRLEEFRIGFALPHNKQVVHGCMWPLLGNEEGLDEDQQTAYVADEIIAVLRTLGINDVRHLQGLFPAEFCEDCGAPYFPDPLGAMQHPELPEEVDSSPIALH